jgi:voltage-gated potassium channel
VERDHPDANIDSIAEALWWAVVTVTSVGYGDAFPMTAAGRVVAIVLMILGIGLFGILAAALASYFLATEEGPNPQKSSSDSNGSSDCSARYPRPWSGLMPRPRA